MSTPERDEEPCTCDPQRSWERPWYAHQPGCPMRAECDGSENCPAMKHVHGCFMDSGDCDQPHEHPAPESDTDVEAERLWKTVRKGIDCEIPGCGCTIDAHEAATALAARVASVEQERDEEDAAYESQREYADECYRKMLAAEARASSAEARIEELEAALTAHSWMAFDDHGNALGAWESRTEATAAFREITAQSSPDSIVLFGYDADGNIVESTASFAAVPSDTGGET